jgi:hypothetical protein
MSLDRYTKAVLTVAALALAIIAARPWLPDGTPLSVLRPEPALAQGAAPKYEVTVPKAWGKLIAFSNNNLLLEASDGTWRIVDVEGKSPEYPKVKAQIRWQ